MSDTRYYTDLLKAHKLFVEIEERWKFYDVYMKSRDTATWMQSENVPLREGLLLFGFIQGWDANFQGDLQKFLAIYKDIFPIVKDFRDATIIRVAFSDNVKNSISVIFEKIARCPKRKRFESTDASKILHTINPSLFVMRDSKIR